MITIDDAELERGLAEEARRTGERPEDVARRVLARALSGAEPTEPSRTLLPEERARRRAILLQYQEEMARLPELDARSADEIIGYDERGLPA